MKRIFEKLAIVTLMIITAICAFAGCEKNYSLTESTFFKVMTNMVYFPENYLNATIELDCFVYEITDVKTGAEYVCGVRKCSSGYGCTCGNDTIIGFILEYDGEIPAAKNQSADTNDKAWIHLKGTLVDANKTYVNVYSYADGVATENTEQIYFYRFAVEELTAIDGSGLAYYVT